MSEIRALLLTDVVDSTKISEALGDAAMAELWAAHDRMARDLLSTCGGREIDKTDGMLLLFEAAADAVGYALAYLRALAALAVPLRARAGLHVGPVILRENSTADVARGAKPLEVDGLAKPTAARVVALALGGQLLLTADARKALGETSRQVQSHGHWMFKGITDPVELFEVGEAYVPFVAPPDGEKAYRVVRSGERWVPVKKIPNNLPQQVTSFIGRENEQAEVLRLLAKHRLVTLIGPGGVGKTRLSLQVGFECLFAYPDGTWFVDLAQLSEAQLVAEAAAGVLGLPLGAAGSPVSALVTFLKDKKTLIIFDNCEHLIAACAQLADAIIRGCPRVVLMASSREALAVPGEHVCLVGSLTTPDRAEQANVGVALGHAAVRLFVDRASATSASFAITDGNTSTVVEICRRLDGIPLAIELAARRARMLSLEQILNRLNDRFRILTDGARTVLPRQQTLRATIDWSYNLLSVSEKTLLARLSVFAGGWTMEAAKEVGSGNPIDDEAIFDALASLVDKSLVSVDFAQAEPRYKMLESTLQYALEKLAERSESVWRRRHAEYLLRQFEKADRAWPTIPTEAWLEAYKPELENLRAALEWSFGANGDSTLGVTLFAFTGQYWIQVSMQGEFRRWLKQAVAKLSDQVSPRIAGRIWLSHAQAGSPGNPAFIESGMRALALAREAGEPGLLGRSLTHAAYLQRPRDAEAADSHIAEAQKVLRPLGRTKWLAGLLNVLGGSLNLRGDTQASRKCYAESIDISRELGDWLGYAAPSFNLVDDDFNAGHVEAAIVEASKLVDQCREHRGLGLLGLMYFYFGDYLLAANRQGEAKTIGIEGIRLNRSLGRSAPVNACIETVALSIALEGECERASRLAGYVKAFYENVSFVRGPTQQRTWERLMAIANEKLGPGGAEQLMAEGAVWSEDRAINEATRI